MKFFCFSCFREFCQWKGCKSFQESLSKNHFALYPWKSEVWKIFPLFQRFRKERSRWNLMSFYVNSVLNRSRMSSFQSHRIQCTSAWFVIRKMEPMLRIQTVEGWRVEKYYVRRQISSKGSQGIYSNRKPEMGNDWRLSSSLTMVDFQQLLLKNSSLPPLLWKKIFP